MVNWMIGNAALLGTLKVKGLHVLSTHKLKYLEVKQVGLLSLFSSYNFTYPLAEVLNKSYR